MELRTKRDTKTKENSLLLIKKNLLHHFYCKQFLLYTGEKKTEGSIILWQQYINLLRGKEGSDKNYVHIILSGL